MEPLTAERLRQLLSYDPETGVFRRRVTQTNRNKVGDVAGTPNDKGYLLIMVDGRRYLAHRLAWFYVYGEWPAGEIDHINRQRSDNRIANLRDATRSLNTQNTGMFSSNTSGKKGVSFHRASGKWQARIGLDGRLIHLGVHATKELAALAYEEARAKYHKGAIQ